jgi:DNA repair ATPase RecN
MKPQFNTIIFAVFVCSLILSSCKNKQVSADIANYCECLEQQNKSLDGREVCFEMMDDIKKKYESDSRALIQILEETERCL